MQYCVQEELNLLQLVIHRHKLCITINTFWGYQLNAIRHQGSSLWIVPHMNILALSETVLLLRRKQFIVINEVFLGFLKICLQTGNYILVSDCKLSFVPLLSVPAACLMFVQLKYLQTDAPSSTTMTLVVTVDYFYAPVVRSVHDQDG